MLEMKSTALLNLLLIRQSGGYVQELGEKVERKLSASIYFAEDSTKLHSWHGKVELTVFEGENVVVRAGKERMRTEKELNGLIALGDADRRLNAFKERQISFTSGEKSITSYGSMGLILKRERDM